MKLQTLEIKSFRGATQPVKITFDKGKKITMVYGENGNGKSTISDALICLLSSENELGSLDDRSSEAKQKKYIISSPCKAEDLQIKLTTDSGVFAANFNGKKNAWISVTGTGMPSVVQLRRKQLTKVIDAIPSERYKELSKYIDVTHIENGEQKLKDLEKDLKATVERQTSVLVQAQDTLQRIWEAENKPRKNYLDWALAEQSKNVSKERAKLDAIKLVLDSWTRIDAVLSEIRTAIENASKTQADFEKAQKDLEDERIQNNDNDATLITLLQNAQSFLEQQTELSECPVCRKENKQDDLLAAVRDRLNALLRMQELMATLAIRTKERDGAKSLLDSAYKRFHTYLQAFAGYCLAENMGLSDEMLKQVLSDLRIDDQVNAQQAFKRHHDVLKTFRQSLLKETEGGENTIRQYNHISQQYNAINDTESQLVQTQTLLDKVTQALKIVTEKRKAFIEAELKSICSEVQRMYDILHPGESIGGLNLYLDPKKPGSLSLSGDFYDEKDIEPQGFYSESHLDTLGLCVFFALAKKYNTGNTILILDDVVMSVDHTHLSRFIDLINQEAAHFTHVLVTTHYQPWRNLYKHHRAGGSIQFIELKPWTLRNGISIQSFRIDYTDLQKAMVSEEYDAQVIAGKAGIFLENMLDFLAGRFQCRLPYTADAKYTLGTYLNCFDKKLLNALQVHHLTKDHSTGQYIEDVTTIKTPLKDIIQELRDMAFIRNEIGAHFNLNAMVSTSEVLAFGETTLKLARLLICPEDGSLPIKERSGSFWATPTGSIRLHPLKEPS